MKKVKLGGKDGKRMGRREKERGGVTAGRDPLEQLWRLGQGGSKEAFCHSLL